MKKIAILLTVHNRREKTISCLKNIFSQKLDEGFDISVFMTDDGCTDGTSEAVSEKYPLVEIISGDGSLFWNRGMHRAWLKAIELGTYDFILWLNDDTRLMPNALMRLLSCSNTVHDKSIIVGSTLADESNRTFSYGGKTGGIRQSPLYPDNSELKECVTFNGNIVLIPKYVCENIGIIDPKFRHSFGDVEYGLRATKKGLTNYLAPGYYGYCIHNNPIPLFRRKCYSIFKRFRLLYSPLGYNPLEAYYMNSKYFSCFSSFCFSVKLHLNVLFPVDHTKFDNFNEK